MFMQCCCINISYCMIPTIHIYIYIFTHIHANIYIYSHTHTHTHTYTHTHTHIYIYNIYIYYHLRTDHFFVSQLFSAARQAGYFKLESKCSILTFDPARHAIPNTRKLHIPLAWASLVDNMGQG